MALGYARQVKLAAGTETQETIGRAVLARPADALPDPARRLRILFPFEGGLAGGSHMSALLLFERLDRAEFDPSIQLHSADGLLAAHLEQRGIPFDLAPPDIAPVRRSDLVTRLHRRAAALKNMGIDIVHTNEGLMHAAWGPAARLAGSAMLWHHRGNPKARGLRLLAPWCADRLVSVSTFSLPQPGRFSALGRASVIRSPFDTGDDLAKTRALASECRRSLKIADDALVLGFFGHFAARKRPVLFLEALAATRAKLKRPVFGLMFGEPFDPGSAEAVDAAIERLGLSDNVRKMGFIRPVEPWISTCDINVVTAVEEPFGRTLIEAMLIGTVVVAARSGGNPEAICDGETGRLVTPDDPDAFADAIISLADDCERARIAARAMAEATNRFGITEHVERISALYRDMTLQRRPY